LAGPRADCPLWLSQGGEFASEEDERVTPRRDVKVQDLPEDDPVVARDVLGDDLALEADESICQQRHAAAP